MFGPRAAEEREFRSIFNPLGIENRDVAFATKEAEDDVVWILMDSSRVRHLLENLDSIHSGWKRAGDRIEEDDITRAKELCHQYLMRGTKLYVANSFCHKFIKAVDKNRPHIYGRMFYKSDRGEGYSKNPEKSNQYRRNQPTSRQMDGNAELEAMKRELHEANMKLQGELRAAAKQQQKAMEIQHEYEQKMFIAGSTTAAEEAAYLDSISPDEKQQFLSFPRTYKGLNTMRL